VPDVDTDTVTVGVTDTLGDVVDDPETETVTDCDGLPVGEPLGEIVGVAVFEVVTVVDKDGLAEPVIDGLVLLHQTQYVVLQLHLLLLAQHLQNRVLLLPL